MSAAETDRVIPLYLAVQTRPDRAALYLPNYGYIGEPIQVTPYENGSVLSLGEKLYRGALICEEDALLAALNKEYHAGRGLDTLLRPAVDGAEIVEFTDIQFNFYGKPVEKGNALVFPVLSIAKTR